MREVGRDVEELAASTQGNLIKPKPKIKKYRAACVLQSLPQGLLGGHDGPFAPRDRDIDCFNGEQKPKKQGWN